ncbi:CrcB family protein [Solirubrobacter sp. CPCC 204708]|uniref:Fluoride-specific ion channel FluC n=1 Tax=Solirubrobacter deserti TaxID=2282478 RepID=A0ABT4RC57_9ACTN|nr:CrcB family protein [Solirubrobacter deserti]MBE2315482.1 CrcB family protein [Solirubrobacter deserti]MDA0136122.1 CrcB family protein [Solirubrobacter deserti]
MTSWLALALAGGLGAMARYLVSYALPVPYGTLAVNVSGAFALGLLGDNFVLGTGFVGAYTTFSTWMLETDRLSRNAAIFNIMGSLVLGLAAAGLGITFRGAG